MTSFALIEVFSAYNPEINKRNVIRVYSNNEDIACDLLNVLEEGKVIVVIMDQPRYFQVSVKKSTILIALT